MKKTTLLAAVMLAVSIFTSCKKFIDVIPDNTPQLSNAFAMRTMALRYLNTCYSRMPANGSFAANPAYLSGDELWLNSTTNFTQTEYPNWYIALGSQNSDAPLNNYWNGTNGAKDLWDGIRDCNIFLENIQSVPDMDAFEKNRWAAEVTFLKAYYHYYLMRMYGPVHIMDTNVESYAQPAETQLERRPVDECTSYIIGLIDKAIVDLPDDITEVTTENGRISKVIAYAIKAEILVTAASPLFNGNTDYPTFKDRAGQLFINNVYSEKKWSDAAGACKEAVQFAESKGRRLFTWTPLTTMTTPPQQSTKNQMSFREAITERQGNTEQIWVNNGSRADKTFQALVTPRSCDPAYATNTALTGSISATVNMALLFYSKNGVPIEEDPTYDYAGRFAIRSVPIGNSAYSYNLTPGYTTVGLHFDREDRFYACLSFDGGRYFMSSQTSDNLAFSTNYKVGGNVGIQSPTDYIATGYTPKKLVSYRNVTGASNAYTVFEYATPNIRLADLYLLYAEALNESSGPSAEVYRYLDLVRARAGLRGVQESWAAFSNSPNKPGSKQGLREIIQRERSIELMFEGKRFWDLRRWKTATSVLNTNIIGWSIRETTPEQYYRQQTLYSRKFGTKDYLWPLDINELRRNTNLSQNPEW